MALSNRLHIMFAAVLAQLSGDRERKEHMDLMKRTASRGRHHRARFNLPAACVCNVEDGKERFCKRHRAYVCDGRKDR